MTYKHPTFGRSKWGTKYPTKPVAAVEVNGRVLVISTGGHVFELVEAEWIERAAIPGSARAQVLEDEAKERRRIEAEEERRRRQQEDDDARWKVQHERDRVDTLAREEWWAENKDERLAAARTFLATFDAMSDEAIADAILAMLRAKFDGDFLRHSPWSSMHDFDADFVKGLFEWLKAPFIRWEMVRVGGYLRHVSAYDEIDWTATLKRVGMIVDALVVIEELYRSKSSGMIRLPTPQDRETIRKRKARAAQLAEIETPEQATG